MTTTEQIEQMFTDARELRAQGKTRQADKLADRATRKIWRLTGWTGH